MCVVVSKADAPKIANGIIIGEIASGDKRVELI